MLHLAERILRFFGRFIVDVSIILAIVVCAGGAIFMYQGQLHTACNVQSDIKAFLKVNNIKYYHAFSEKNAMEYVYMNIWCENDE